MGESQGELNRDEVTRIVEAVIETLRREGETDDTLPAMLPPRVEEEHPEVIEYLKRTRPLVEPHQALQWYLSPGEEEELGDIGG